MGSVQRGEVRCGEGGDVVGLQGGGVGAEGAADDLLDLAAVEIDTWAEACHCVGLVERDVLKIYWDEEPRGFVWRKASAGLRLSRDLREFVCYLYSWRTFKCSL